MENNVRHEEALGKIGRLITVLALKPWAIELHNYGHCAATCASNCWGVGLHVT